MNLSNLRTKMINVFEERFPTDEDYLKDKREKINSIKSDFKLMQYVDATFDDESRAVLAKKLDVSENGLASYLNMTLQINGCKY